MAVHRARRPRPRREADGADGGRRPTGWCAAAAQPRRDAGGRAHRALQPGGGRGATAAARARLHRGAPAGHVPRAQPRHRRRLRPDDPRPRRRAVDRRRADGERRGGRRAGAHAPGRHRQRPAPIRRRLHRQPDGQPHQPRPGPQDPLLPAAAPTCRSTTRRRRSSIGRSGRRRAAAASRPFRAARSRSSRTSHCGASSRTSWPPCATAGAPGVTGERRARGAATRRR